MLFYVWLQMICIEGTMTGDYVSMGQCTMPWLIIFP